MNNVLISLLGPAVYINSSRVKHTDILARVLGWADKCINQGLASNLAKHGNILVYAKSEILTLVLQPSKAVFLYWGISWWLVFTVLSYAVQPSMNIHCLVVQIRMALCSIELETSLFIMYTVYRYRYDLVWALRIKQKCRHSKPSDLIFK